MNHMATITLHEFAAKGSRKNKFTILVVAAPGGQGAKTQGSAAADSEPSQPGGMQRRMKCEVIIE
jgi:hypothetical protein